jgi:hypothetical protein
MVSLLASWNNRSTFWLPYCHVIVTLFGISIMTCTVSQFDISKPARAPRSSAVPSEWLLQVVKD